jgi:hypothetical protein
VTAVGGAAAHAARVPAGEWQARTAPVMAYQQ